MSKEMYKVSYKGKLDFGEMINLWRYGKSIDLIATFTSIENALLFAEEFQFPLSDNLKKRLYKEK